MAFPQTGILDAFTRADTGPPPSSNWTTVTGTGHVVSSNQLANSAANHSESGWNVQTFGPDVELYYDMATKPSTGKWCDLDIRVSALSAGWSGYQVEFTTTAGTDTIDIYRVDAGSFTALGAQIALDFLDGDGFGVEMVGNTITVYRRTGGSWSSVGTRTDSTYTGAGYLVVGSGDTTTARLDNVGGGTIGPGAGSDLSVVGLSESSANLIRVNIIEETS
jgi:hypothetical protein